jgi:hypothetical protein
MLDKLKFKGGKLLIYKSQDNKNHVRLMRAELAVNFFLLYKVAKSI